MITPSNQVGGALPGLSLKAWAQISAAGALIRGFNVTSTSKAGTGQYQLNFAVAMATSTYVVRAMGYETGGAAVTQQFQYSLSSRGTGSVRVTGTSNGALQDQDTFVEVYE